MNYELSPIGKKIDELLEQKLKKYPEVTLISNTFGTHYNIDTEEFIPNENMDNCMCPISLLLHKVKLCLHTPEGIRYSTLKSLIPEINDISYMTAFIDGVDSKEYRLDAKETEAYNDGVAIQQKYNIKAYRKRESI